MLISLNRLFSLADQTWKSNRTDGECKTNKKPSQPAVNYGSCTSGLLQIKRSIMQRVTGNQVTTKSAAINRSPHVGGGEPFKAAQLKPGNREKCSTWFLVTSTCATFPFFSNEILRRSKKKEGNVRSQISHFEAHFSLTFMLNSKENVS